MAPVRIESVDCEVEIEPGRKVAAIESVRLLSDTVEPGHELKGVVTLKPFKGERETVEISLQIPADFPEGSHEAIVLRRRQQRPAHRSGTIRASSSPTTCPGCCARSEGADRSEADGRVPARGRAGPGRLDPGPGAAEPAGERTIGVRVQARGLAAPDSLGHDAGRADAMGHRRVALAPIHGGQGRGAVVIVVSMSRRRPTRCGRPGRADVALSRRPRLDSIPTRTACESPGLHGGSPRPGSSPYSSSEWWRPRHRRASGLAPPRAKVETWRQEGPPRRSRSPIARAWSSPTTAGSGWVTPSRPSGH